jgi:hypothetical protein
LVTQLRGLLLRRFLQRAGQQAAYGRYPDFFHLGQIDIQTRPLLAPLLANDDLSPALGQFLDPPEIL